MSPALLVALLLGLFEPTGVEPNKGSPGGQEATGGKVDIAIRDGRFAPPVMRVRVSQIVVWTNEGRVAHAVAARVRGGLPRSRWIAPGGRFEYTPLRAGRVSYACPLHAGMRGALIVKRS